MLLFSLKPLWKNSLIEKLVLQSDGRAEFSPFNFISQREGILFSTSVHTPLCIMVDWKENIESLLKLDLLSLPMLKCLSVTGLRPFKQQHFL